jgi:pimeloyl-ACP methyl ester carboxylesterase
MATISPTSKYAPATPTLVEAASAVFTDAEVTSLTDAMTGPPVGKWCRGRLGWTHFKLDEPAADVAKSPREVITCAHGLGTNLGVYAELSKALTGAGYTVLRYEYFSHGWSKSDDPFLKMGEAEMVTQVEDLLNLVLEPNEPMRNFIGHSTGGIVAVNCSKALKERNICRFCFVSPAFWANKPAVAILAEKVPNFVFGLVKSRLKPFLFMIQDAYNQNFHLAFANPNKSKKNYRYPEVYDKCYAFNQNLYKKHPNFLIGVASIGNFYLNSSLLGKWRDNLTECMTNGGKCRDIYGSEDFVVPVKSQEAFFSKLDNSETRSVEQQGHESLYENTDTISPLVVEFFDNSK